LFCCWRSISGHRIWDGMRAAVTPTFGMNGRGDLATTIDAIDQVGPKALQFEEQTFRVDKIFSSYAVL